MEPEGRKLYVDDEVARNAMQILLDIYDGADLASDTATMLVMDPTWGQQIKSLIEYSMQQADEIDTSDYEVVEDRTLQ